MMYYQISYHQPRHTYNDYNHTHGNFYRQRMPIVDITLCKQRVFSLLVLCHFVQSVLSALFAFTKGSSLFRYVNLQRQ